MTVTPICGWSLATTFLITLPYVHIFFSLSLFIYILSICIFTTPVTILMYMMSIMYIHLFITIFFIFFLESINNQFGVSFCDMTRLFIRYVEESERNPGSMAGRGSECRFPFVPWALSP